MRVLVLVATSGELVKQPEVCWLINVGDKFLLLGYLYCRQEWTCFGCSIPWIRIHIVKDPVRFVRLD